MRKLFTVLALTATTLSGVPALAGGQYYGNDRSYQTQNNAGYSDRQDDTYRDRNGNLRDRNGNIVNERYAATTNNNFYVDRRGALRDRQGRVVTGVRAERNGWVRDRRGYWVQADPNYAQNGYYRDRNGVLVDRNGNRVDDRYASSAGYNGQTWVGEDGRTYCKRSNGTTGLLIGGVAGALLGRAIDGGRNSAVGTILGGGAGALAGRQVERSQSNECR